MHGIAAEDNPGPGADQVAYTVRNAAKLLDIGERTCWQIVMDAERHYDEHGEWPDWALRSFKIGNSRRILRADLLDYARQLARSSNPPKDAQPPSRPPKTDPPPAGPKQPDRAA